MHTGHYSAYGLVLGANGLIPSLVAVPPTSRVDVEVWLGGRPSWADGRLEGPQPIWYVSPHEGDGGQPALTVRQLAGGAYFRLLYGDGTEFLVDRSGSEVWARWPDTLTLEDAASYLVGPVLGFVLRLRGIVCLHASAIAVDDRAVAFLGPVGAGKSTTAAALASRDYPVLSDDLVALRDQGETVLVQPGYPRLRLWPASAEAVSAVAGAVPPLRRVGTSRRYHLDLTQDGYRFQRHPLPLGAIYVLDGRCPDGAAPFVETLPGSDVVMTLVANTSANYLLDRTMRAREFELLAGLIARVPLRRLHPRADLASLSRLCDVILDDLGTTVSSASP